MKKELLLIILVCFTVSCTGNNNQTVNDSISNTDGYVSFFEDPYRFLTVEASVNGSAPNFYALDSGGSSGLISMDSAFFYNNIDTTNLTYKKPRIRMYYFQAFYEGNIPVSIGEHTFYVKGIEVRNFDLHHKGSGCIGFIGEEVFLNKITEINYDEMKIGFFDARSIDSSYTSLPLFPPRKVNPGRENQKYVEINGFKNKQGDKIKGYFLFDTGCTVTALAMKTSFAKKLFINSKTLKPVTSVGHSGSVYQDVKWNIDSISIGNINLLQVPARKAKDPSLDALDALNGGDGLLGVAYLLRRFNIVVDYKNNLLYLKPNKSFPKEKRY
jgi:hypothetical protein